MASIPYRSNDDLCAEAEQFFLAAHHPSGEIPVPIEEIVEFDLGIGITPIPGLQSRFRIDGSISLDLTEIIVDDRIMERVPVRYRFTLAHEVGHFVLHQSVIRRMQVANPEDWKREILRTSAEDYSRMEFQAYEFAGCVLVPRKPLVESFEQANEIASDRGLNLEEMGTYGFEHAAEWIAPRFEVSRQVIERRLKREGFWSEE